VDTEQLVEPGLIPTEELLVRVRKTPSLQTIRNWIRNKQFPKPRYVGTRAYWDESEVEAWLRSQP
jgi:predicted DNA-binding transcriptional regulator AlpA